MSTHDVIDQRLRAALGDLRPDPEAFESGVKDRMAGAEANDATEDGAHAAIAALPGWVRAAASVLPVPFLAGGKVLAGAAKTAPLSVGSKLLGWLALPAVAVCLALGGFVFAVVQTRRATSAEAASANAAEYKQAMSAWMRRWGWLAALYFGALYVALLTSHGGLLFAGLVGSFFVFAFALIALARAGLATRQAIGSLCGAGFWLLSMFFGMGMGASATPHLLAPALVPAVWYLGWGIFAAIQFHGRSRDVDEKTRKGRALALCMVPVVALLVGWVIVPRLMPTTAEDVQEYVESFDRAKHGSATWEDWEFCATWLRESGRTYDERRPRALFEATLRGAQGPYMLSRGMRAGLLRPGDFRGLRELEKRRTHLLRPSMTFKRLFYTDQDDWAVRVTLAEGGFTPAERAFLAERLIADLKDAAGDDKPFRVLEDTLRITQLLELLGHPIDLATWRPQVHKWLEACHKHDGSGFRRGGGFATYPSGAPSYDGTYYAVALMRIYGYPASIDANEVRSFLQDDSKATTGKYIVTITKDMFEALPDVPKPTFWDYIVYERMLIVSILLVLLCLYAMLAAPSIPAAAGDAADAEPPSM